MKEKNQVRAKHKNLPGLVHNYKSAPTARRTQKNRGVESQKLPGRKVADNAVIRTAIETGINREVLVLMEDHGHPKTTRHHEL